MALRVVGLLGWLALFYVVLVANVVLHELGHALMARIVRFRVVHIVAGPFVLWWERGRPRLHFTGSFSHLLGGHVATFPLRLSPRLRGAIIAVLAAGPAVSFLSMLTAFTVFLAVEPTPQEPGFVGAVLCVRRQLLVRVSPVGSRGISRSLRRPRVARKHLRVRRV